MKKILALAALFCFASVVRAQPSPPPAIQQVASDPTGNACTGASPILGYSGTQYGCHGGVYAAIGSGGGGTPGGSNTQVQFNDSNAFGGSANFTFNKGTNQVCIGTCPATGVSIGALGTPTNWNFDTTSANTALLSLGIASYLASPPAIGGTAAAAGSFTAVTATSVTLSPDGVHNQKIEFAGNTTDAAVSSNTVGFGGPNTSATGTAYRCDLPWTNPAGSVLECPTPVAGVSTGVWGAVPVGAFTGYYSVGVVTWNNAGNCTYNATGAYSTDGSVTTVTGQSCTLVATNLVSGGYYNLIITNGSGAAATLTLGTGGSTCTAWKVGGSGAGAVTLSGASKIDILAFHMVGTVCYANFKGDFS